MSQYYILKQYVLYKLPAVEHRYFTGNICPGWCLWCNLYSCASYMGKL